MSDLTTQSLEAILASGQYERVEGVPVFDEHERVGRDGKLHQFARKELEEICVRNNKRIDATGDLTLIGPGHTNPDPSAPETSQPRVWGYAHHYRVGPFGPDRKLGVLVDFYVKREVPDGVSPATGKPVMVSWREGLASYPRRSVELWLKEGVIDWIALLARAPERDLGLLTYAKRGPLLFYAMENDDMDPTAAPDAMDPDKEFEEKFMRCMKSNFPTFVEQYSAGASPDMPPGDVAPPAPPAPPGSDVPPPPGAPAMTPPPEQFMAFGSPTNAAPPSPTPPNEVARMQRDQKAIADARRIAALEQQVASLAKARADEVLRYRRSEAERAVIQLQGEGYVLDRAEEVEQYMKLDEAGCQKRSDYIRKTHKQNEGAGLPTGEMLHIANLEEPAPAGSNGNGQLTEPQLKEVLRYMRSNDTSFDAAREAYLKRAQ